MNKNELIWDVADNTGFPGDASERAVSATLESIAETISKGEDVVIPGFGTFSRKIRKPEKDIIQRPANVGLSMMCNTSLTNLQ